MSIAYGPKKIIRTAAAQLNHISTDGGSDTSVIGRACDLSLYIYASIQLVWSGLAAPGAQDATLTVEVSDDGTNWKTKKTDRGGVISDCVLTPLTAAGNDFVHITDVTERFYRVNWAKNSITAGTITCLLIAKD